MSPGRERAFDALVLAVTKVALGAWVLHQGFTHVSDDDYARTVIAQQFAHAPKLDPSGTSWLPLPFWIAGTAMMAAGRTLGVARAAAVTMGAASVAAPYLAMRAAGTRRVAAVLATGIAMALPWNAWLGVATVPEAWFGAIVAAAVIVVDLPAARPWAAGALLAASLSRYEAWPACALVAIAWAGRAAKGDRRGRDVACAAVAAAGPLAWMAWNAVVHGDALHFVARVTRFRQAIGAADVPLVEKLLTYPRSLVVETPEVAVLGAMGLVGLMHPALRARWRWAAAAAGATLVFLVWGDVRDGAPTHHPTRALAAVWWVLVGMGADAVATWIAPLRTTMRIRAASLALAACVVWCAWLPGRWARCPGRDAEDRTEQVKRGLDLRARDVTHVDITPCAFEHFALLAAWGAPERATVRPRTDDPVTVACPHVAER